jgi:hypothetical protein
MPALPGLALPGLALPPEQRAAYPDQVCGGDAEPLGAPASLPAGDRGSGAGKDASGPRAGKDAGAPRTGAAGGGGQS